MSDSLISHVEVNSGDNPQACVIWMHGLGDSGHGFTPIVPELKLPNSLPVKFLFPHAPVRPVTINNNMEMPAWYDIKSLDFNSRADLTGVEESAQQIKQLFDAQVEAGFSPDKIVLAGFSQGGVIAYHLGLRMEQPIAGILALSTYMCEPGLITEQASDANRNVPVFVAHGEQDPVVPIMLGEMAVNTLKENGYQPQWRTYNMQHNVCLEEVEHVSAWLQERLA
ncbi:alpha/beta hydrolase [Salinimonas chungwhensis]|uniref:alpha/beta hydrolase n=1 Tax=Salinimonas chungwhensis TaxID=265425 RepID=UPI000364C04F|nr:dienelactone hydrolase family protein [Salinimonas chungwhensis]